MSFTPEQVGQFDVFGALAEPEPRTWQQGWDEVTEGFGRYQSGGWRWSTSRQIYQELYRALTHGHGLSPDDALSFLGAAYHAAASDTEEA